MSDTNAKMWQLENWSFAGYSLKDKTVTVYHHPSGQRKVLDIPPLIIKLLEFEYTRGRQELRDQLKKLILG